MRGLLYLYIFLLSTLLLSVGALAEDATEFIQKGDEAYGQRFNISANSPEEFFAAYRPYMQQALVFYEKAIPLMASLAVQSQAHVYNRLAQLNYELSKLLTDRKEIEGVLWQGKEYAFASMKLHPGFSESRFVDTLRYVDDVAPLMWGAHSWGTWLGYHPLEGLINVGKVRAMYERAIQVDERYWGGSAHNALGSLLAGLGDLNGAKLHFEKAIEIDPNYLQNYVVYVQYYGFSRNILTGELTGIRKGQEQFIEEKLNFVLNAPIQREYPFWSWIAKKEAAELLEKYKAFKK